MVQRFSNTKNKKNYFIYYFCSNYVCSVCFCYCCVFCCLLLLFIVTKERQKKTLATRKTTFTSDCFQQNVCVWQQPHRFYMDKYNDVMNRYKHTDATPYSVSAKPSTSHSTTAQPLLRLFAASIYGLFEHRSDKQCQYGQRQRISMRCTPMREAPTVQNIGFWIGWRTYIEGTYDNHNTLTHGEWMCVFVRAFASVIRPIVRIFMFIQKFAVFVPNQSRNA